MLIPNCDSTNQTSEGTRFFIFDVNIIFINLKNASASINRLYEHLSLFDITVDFFYW